MHSPQFPNEIIRFYLSLICNTKRRKCMLSDSIVLYLRSELSISNAYNGLKQWFTLMKLVQKKNEFDILLIRFEADNECFCFFSVVKIFKKKFDFFREIHFCSQLSSVVVT